MRSLILACALVVATSSAFAASAIADDNEVPRMTATGLVDQPVDVLPIAIVDPSLAAAMPGLTPVSENDLAEARGAEVSPVILPLFGRRGDGPPADPTQAASTRFAGGMAAAFGAIFEAARLAKAAGAPDSSSLTQVRSGG
jgi:hypothetical protein